MKDDFPYLCFMKIAQEGRSRLIDDVLDADSDLYSALYSDLNSEIFQIKMEIYELKWIESHWKEITKILENTSIPISEKKELATMFAKWYGDFVSNWKPSIWDETLINDKIQILRKLVLVNDGWEQEIKKMEVAFKKSHKILNNRIKSIERGVQ